ncbi:unnamed protein product [Dibothriocephalus latus]|uniref:Uncharacterized protein n=1 Tax=Dibothriocephalus latus TaxID=60516 RepID=A0A3P7NL40_DIBLA|nr:unnamed protein product [Dibothriocephalus latus]
MAVSGSLCIISFFTYFNIRSVAVSSSGVILEDLVKNKVPFESPAILYDAVHLYLDTQKSLLIGIALFSLLLMAVAAVGIVLSACRANCMILAVTFCPSFNPNSTASVSIVA